MEAAALRVQEAAAVSYVPRSKPQFHHGVAVNGCQVNPGKLGEAAAQYLSAIFDRVPRCVQQQHDLSP
jgi:hypothetical protein